MAGSGVKIVISLDLHGILTDRILRQVDGFAAYWTYPHVDFADTGSRAARLLLKLLDGDVRPTTARVVIPALVRGDELITKVAGQVRETAAANSKAVCYWEYYCYYNGWCEYAYACW